MLTSNFIMLPLMKVFVKSGEGQRGGVNGHRKRGLAAHEVYLQSGRADRVLSLPDDDPALTLLHAQTAGIPTPIPPFVNNPG